MPEKCCKTISKLCPTQTCNRPIATLQATNNNN